MGSCGAAESACSSEGETGLEHDHGDDMLTVPLLNGNSRNLDEPASVLKSRDNPPLDRSMDGLNWNQGGGTRSRAQGCTDDPSRDTDGQGSKIRTNLKDCEDEKLRALERCIAAATKGFVIGAGLRGGLGLFAILSRLRRKKTRSSILHKSNADAVVLALKETLRYGLFLGTFAGGFCSVDEAIATLGGRERWVLMTLYYQSGGSV